MFSMLATGAIKPFSDLVMAMDQANHMDSAIVNEFSVGYHPVITKVFFQCIGASNESTVNSYANRQTMANFNAILIFTKSEANNLLSSRDLDSRSKYQLSSCNGNYCYCAARLSLKDGYNFWHDTVYDSGCVSGDGLTSSEKIEILIPSIAVGNFNLDNCLSETHVKIFACKGERYPLVLNGKDIKIIQYFYTKNLFLIKQKSGNSYQILFKYIDPNDCDNSSCVYITDWCPYYAKDNNDKFDW